MTSALLRPAATVGVERTAHAGRPPSGSNRPLRCPQLLEVL